MLEFSSERLLEKVLGLRAFAFQSEVYRTGHPMHMPHEPFKLPRLVQQELQVAAALGLLASTTLKTSLPAEERVDLSDPVEPSPAVMSLKGLHAPGALKLPSDLEALYLKFSLATWGSVSSNRLEFRLDFVEVYAGTAGLSRAMAAEGFVVGPPIEVKDGWDMVQPELLQLLLRLTLAGRISVLWLGPPCTTCSLARHPRLRSSEQPWGFDLTCPEVIDGNLHMYRSLALFLTQSLGGGVALVETPWGAYSRKLSWW